MCCAKGPTVFRPHHRVSNDLQIRIKVILFQDPIFGVWIAPKDDRLEEQKVKLKKSKR